MHPQIERCQHGAVGQSNRYLCALASSRGCLGWCSAMQSAVASLTTTPVPLRRESSIAGSSKDLLPLTPAQIKQKAREVNLQGLEANRAGDTKVALSCFERAHELDPDEASYLLSAANMTLKVERLNGTSARSRRSALMYMKVLEFPALPPRLAEKARAKLEEVQAAQELDAERELSLGGWAGGAGSVLVGTTGYELRGDALEPGDGSVPTAELTRRLQRRAALLLLLSLLFAPAPQGLLGIVAGCTVLCCCACADQGPASNLGCARCAAWASAVFAAASSALCALGAIALRIYACPTAAEAAGAGGGGGWWRQLAEVHCVAWPDWPVPWLPPLALALALAALQLAHACAAVHTARGASALLRRVRLALGVGLGLGLA